MLRKCFILFVDIFYCRTGTFFVAVLFAICTVFRTIKSNAKQTLANCFLLCLYTLEVIYMNAVIYARYSSDNQREESIEAVVHAELERYILQTRNVLIQNKEFLEKTAEALAEKKTFLYSDIQSIKNSVTITKCVA